MKKIIQTENAPKAIGPYSQATKAAGLVFISGQLPIDPQNGQMPNNVEEQTKQSMENIKASILEEYDVDESTLEKDVADFIHLLKTHSLLQENE